MANTTLTPNMNLIIPTPGTDPGPDYANNNNQDFTIIDSHNHSPGSGVQITPAGMNISSNLNFQNNQATNVYGIKFSSPANSSNIGFLYTAPQSGGGIDDLFYNDGAGNVIALTKAGQVNATIASLPGESYAAGTFTWKQGAGSTNPANFDIGSITIRPNTAGTANGVVLGPPTGIASLYNVQLPALPSGTSFVQLDTSGNLSASIRVTGGLTTSNLSSTAGILGSQLSSTAGILGTQIAASTIEGANIDVATVTGFNIAPNTITGLQVISLYGGTSSSTGSFSTTSNSYVGITNLIMAITLGNGVNGGINSVVQPDGTTNGASIIITGGSSSTDQINFRLFDSNTGTAKANIQISVAANQTIFLPPSLLTFNGPVLYASHTFTWQVKTTNAVATVQVNNCVWNIQETL